MAYKERCKAGETLADFYQLFIMPNSVGYLFQLLGMQRFVDIIGQ